MTGGALPPTARASNADIGGARFDFARRLFQGGGGVCFFVMQGAQLPRALGEARAAGIGFEINGAPEDRDLRRRFAHGRAS